LKILFLTYSYLPNLGGVERSVFNLARLMIRRGHEVTVATHGGTAVPFRYQQSPQPATLRIHIPNQSDSRLVVCALRPFLNLLNIIILASFCLGRQIDVVHAHLLNIDTLYAGWLLRLLAIRFVLTLRGGETEEWMHCEARRIYLLRRLGEADAVTAVSRSLLDQAAALVPEIRSRASVIPNPVDCEAIVHLARSSTAQPPASPYLVFCGRLEAMKDVTCLVEAYAQRVAADPAFVPDLVIIGTGSLEDPLRRQARIGAAAGRIHFLGRLAHADTLRWMASALALVLPSRCSEGCPNVLLEAMALSTPVVVSDLPSLREWVDHRVSGLVFPVGRPEVLASRLGELVAEPLARQSRAQVARERMGRQFAMDGIACAYEAIYAGSSRQG
jgi:glycosyltransferase involved in cell wall biosynthesis